MAEFWQFAILGLGVGAIYALVAQSIVLVYRGSGVPNFALGPMAVAGAYAYYETVDLGLPVVVGVLAGVAASAVIGALTYQLVMRFMLDATPLARLGAILGVFTVLNSVLLAIYEDDQVSVTPPLPQDTVGWISHVFGANVVVSVDRLYLFAIGAVISATCWAIYKFTRFGLTTRAVAEKPVAAAALGRSPHLIATANWAAGAALAGFAGILFTNITGLTVGQYNLLLVPALAAALVGGFTSFQVTWLAALATGVVTTIISSQASWLPGLFKQPGWPDAIPFFLIIGILLVRGRSLPIRGFITKRPPHAGTGRVRPTILVLAFFAISVLGSGLGPVDYGGVQDEWVIAISYSIAIGVIAMSMIVVTGYGGQLSLAQFTIAGLGAFACARLYSGSPIFGVSVGGGMPFFLAVLLAVAISVGVGMLVAIPALRTRGFNLAVATLGFAVIVQQLVFTNPDYTGGPEGTPVSSPHLLGIDFDPVFYPRRYMLLCLIVLTLVGLAVTNLRRSTAGRRLLAVRSNERAAASLGINVASVKFYGFGVAAAIAAIGGILLAFRQPNVLMTGYSHVTSISLAVFMILGGVAFIGGAMVTGIFMPGGVGPQLLEPIFGTNYIVPIASGVALVLTVMFNPDGLLLDVSRRWGKLFDWLTARLAPVRAALLAPTRALLEKRRRPMALPAERMTERVEPRTLRIEGMRVSFGGVHAVDEVSLTVAPGEIVGLIGPNGAGKTTLLDAASGFTACGAGTISLDGETIDDWSPHRRAKAGLTRSFQSLELFETLTVADHLRLATEPYTWLTGLRDLVWAPKRPLSPAAITALEELGLLDDIDRVPEQLSHGRRRLLAIARAAAARPSVLMLDEPAAGLDDAESEELGRLLGRLARTWGIAVLLVEHDLELVLSVSDRIAVLNFGKKIAEGTPDEVRSSAEVIAAYVGETDAETLDAGEAGEPVATYAGTALMDGRPTPSARPSTSKPLLHVRSLTAGYGRVAAVRDLDIEVHAGEVVTLLGLNGAGKTTSLLAMSGALKALGGEISWKDNPLSREPMDWRARNGLMLVPEERSVFMDLTVAENLRVGSGDMDFVLELFPELIEKLGSKAGLLSGGQQQMLALGRALASRPSVLMADELSLGLAPIVVTRLLQAIRAAADAGAGVLLVEQHTQAALSVADRAYFLRRGQVVLSGSAHEFRGRAEEVAKAYL
ncbi:ATP-binding cassette domain-containing protein [Streptomyces sp. NPDC047072]|uniref:ATP-binding cassette domain-containing protein n=1 Tax=Streptomyces sp. NPDC047072 TaxID=3154809 RepID=UPI0033FBBBCE